MIIVGVCRSDGSFEDDKKRVINYDNVYVHACSGEKDKQVKEYSYSKGKWVATYKIKTEDFLEAFEPSKPSSKQDPKAINHFYSISQFLQSHNQKRFHILHAPERQNPL